MTAPAEIIWSATDGGHQPGERAKAEAILKEALAICTDERRFLLTGPFVFKYIEEALPEIIGGLGEVNRVRIEQSYSLDKSKRSKK